MKVAVPEVRQVVIEIVDAWAKPLNTFVSAADLSELERALANYMHDWATEVGCAERRDSALSGFALRKAREAEKL